MSDDSEFQRVTAPRDLEAIRNALAAKSAKISCFTDDHHQLLFKISKVESGLVFVEPSTPLSRGLIEGENIQLIVGLSDGLFSIRTTASVSADGDLSFDLGSEIYRLQRRNDFRTTVPSDLKFGVKLTHVRGLLLASKIPLHAINLSAGGMRVAWRGYGKQKLSVGEDLAGIMTLPNGRQIEFVGRIKALSEMGPDMGVLGLEFLNMPLADQQSLLFICVQIHRSQVPVLR